MTRDFKRLSDDELATELAEFEAKLANKPGESRLRNLVHNLRVHQIELEMQNRQLLDTQSELEEARDLYADLYDFAPIGYLTLDGHGVIRRLNLTGARMLGKPRGELVNRPLANYLDRGQSKALFRHLNRAFDTDAGATEELALQAGRSETRFVALRSVRAFIGGETLCRTAMIDVTERKREEQTRRDADTRLALVADNVPVLISYVDASRRYMFNNAAYEKWFGHTRDYIHARHLRDVLGDEAYAEIKPHVDAVLAGQEVHFEAELPYRDAGNRYVSVSYIPHRDQDGTIAGFFALINDLSERHRAERALAEEQEFVSAVLDTAGALVMVMDRRGHVVRFNRECERISGYRAEEVEGRYFDMLLSAEERPGVQDVFQRLSTGDFPNEYENHWVAKDGTPRLIAWSNTALTDQHGAVTHVVATGVDVTERRRIEADLRHRERQLRLVTDAAPVLIAYVDTDMRYRFANAAYREWFDLDPDDMVGRRVEDLMEPDTFETTRNFAGRALQGEEVFYENIVWHQSLGRRYVSASLVPDYEADDMVSGYFSVVTDITERKESEEYEKRRLLEAAHADRVNTVGEMTTEIAHELNQPLTAIATTADVCVDQARSLGREKGGALAEALQEVSAQAHRAAHIVKHVRSFARRKEPELKAVELREIVNGAFSLVRMDARSTGVALSSDLEGEPVVEADTVLIEQLIVNLARNAIEAMSSAGTKKPRVSVTAGVGNGTVEIRVMDNGPGLSVDARQHLFEPFYTSKAEGMGLGLAICRSIVETHGGRMWVDSAPGGGAVFGFTLNIAAANESEQRG